MTALVLVLGFAGAIAAIAYAVHRAHQARIAQLRAEAARLGWTYRGDVGFDTIPRLDRFELFTQGRSKKLTNVMTSPAGDVRAVLFDYTYVTGGGKSQQTHRQTVVYATAGQLTLPTFSLRPQHFLHEIAKAFGYQDIDIERHPAFSEMFLLRGEDEDAVRAMLTPPVIEFLEQRRGACAAGTGREVLFWRAGRLVSPNELESLMQDAMELARRLAMPIDAGDGSGNP